MEIRIPALHNFKMSSDDVLLMNMGYKPELERTMGFFEVFGLSLSCMMVVTGIFAISADALYAGGVGMTWGWFVPGIFVLGVSIALSELSSSMPTSGAMYWWTYRLSPHKYKRVLSFFVGWANLLGLCGATCSVGFGFATMLASLPAITMGYEANKFVTFGIYAAGLVTQVAVGSLSNKIVDYLQWYMVVANIISVFIIVIPLPVGAVKSGQGLNSADFTFGDESNLTNWTYGWAYLISWMPVIWTISTLDAGTHLAERAKNAPRNVPWATTLATGFTWLIGFLVLSIFAAVTKNMDFSRLQNTKYGIPAVQLIIDALNERWALGIMIWFTINQWIVGLDIVVVTSQLIFSFARDGGLPASHVWRRISPQGIPVYGTIAGGAISLALGLLTLIGAEAENAVFTIPVSSCGLAWLIPIFLAHFVAPKNEISPGPFYLGKVFSKINAAVCCVYLVFVVAVLANMPISRGPNSEEMNYTVVINCAIWILALMYYFIDARKWFEGPKVTLDAIEGSRIETADIMLPAKLEGEEEMDPSEKLKE